MDQNLIDKTKKVWNTTNVAVARNSLGDLIVVHSRRTTKPQTPFIISSGVFQLWKERDSKVVIVDPPYEQLHMVIPSYIRNRENEPLILVEKFSDLDFIED
jgi:sulfur relay (sulfurtransferase) DsrF/TusC family protein